MTEHSKIRRDGPKKQGSSGSLFERATSAFGLDSLSAASAPTDLPEIEKRVPEAVRRASAKKTAQIEPTVATEPASAAPVRAPAAPAEKQAVEFSGPTEKISRQQMRESGLIVPEDPVTGSLEEFRIAKRELLADARAGADAKARRIIVCSPHPAEGKTYCALNLAIALAAERDIEVLLIDADVMRPSVPKRLGFKTKIGLMDILANKDLLPEKQVIKTDIDRLFILPLGKRTSRDAEYLASARTGEVLDRLTRGAPNRILIFDTPPALAASAAAELSSHVGQAVLVARADETSRAALEDAAQLLSACDDIKLLLNGAQFSPSGRRFGDYDVQEE
jgi:Mrp family chromosome partitioning ATPase